MRSLSLIVAGVRVVTSTSSFLFGAISLSQTFKMADTPKRSRELESNSLDIEEWTVEEVEQWLTKTGFKEEAPLFSGEQISGKALCELDRETLKELGIQSIGKQLELLRNVKRLFDRKQNQQLHFVKESSKWKRKIRKEDQSTWSESNKNLYRVKIAIVLTILLTSGTCYFLAVAFFFFWLSANYMMGRSHFMHVCASLTNPPQTLQVRSVSKGYQEKMEGVLWLLKAIFKSKSEMQFSI